MGADVSCSSSSLWKGMLTVIGETLILHIAAMFQADRCWHKPGRLMVCLCFFFAPFFSQTSFSRSRKPTWTSSCRLSPSHSRTSPCRRRRAWKSSCPRENPTGPSRSHPWGLVQSRRVSSSSLWHTHKNHHEQRHGCADNSRSYNISLSEGRRWQSMPELLHSEGE